VFRTRSSSFSETSETAILSGGSCDIVKYELAWDLSSPYHDFEMFEERLDAEAVKR
jgi:hypothetical protein